MTLSQLESIRAARLQLLDHGDTQAASLLDWAVMAEPTMTPDQVRDGIADFAADNWPMRKYALAEIEQRIRSIEIRPERYCGAFSQRVES